MRFLLKVEFPVEVGNAVSKKGNLRKTIRSILDDLKPEAVYFLASRGKRAAYIFVEMQDASEIPALAEPWFSSPIRSRIWSAAFREAHSKAPSHRHPARACRPR
jgi:hypothetical protein